VLKKIFLALLIIGLSVPLIFAQEDTPPLSLTYHQLDGNRFVTGQGTFPNVEPFLIEFEITPHWISGTVGEDEPIWFIALEDGTINKFSGEGATEITELESGQPFAAAGDSIIEAPDEASPFTHPVVLNDGTLLYINTAGEIVRLNPDTETARLAVDVIPDARIAVNDSGLVAVYSSPSTRYDHGILGDELEGTTLTIIDTSEFGIISQTVLQDGDVFEGISPFWADIDEDGDASELVTTVSNSSVGAQLRVYRADGSLLAVGPAIGTGFRWRHQLAYGPFGVNGENEIVSVLTPHIGGVVEYYRLRDDRLEIVAQQPGYTSHIIGWPNLDMAVAGDFDGDGQPEIVLGDQSLQTLNGLQRTESGVTVSWTLNLPGTLTSNLAAVALPDGRLALAAGTSEGKVMIWTSVAD
jgi:hypothetical protein